MEGTIKFFEAKIDSRTGQQRQYETHGKNMYVFNYTAINGDITGYIWRLCEMEAEPSPTWRIHTSVSLVHFGHRAMHTRVSH